MCGCVRVCGHHFQQNGHQPGMVANPACGQLAEQGKRNFPCPRSRLRVWSRQLGSAVPSRVSPLVLHTQASIRTVMRHRASPEFIGSHICVTDGVHYREPAQGQ